MVEWYVVAVAGLQSTMATLLSCMTTNHNDGEEREVASRGNQWRSQDWSKSRAKSLRQKKHKEALVIARFFFWQMNDFFSSFRKT